MTADASLPALRLAPVAGDDYAAVHALNEAAVPAVNSVPVAALVEFAAFADAFEVAHAGDRVAGFLVLLAPGASYQSPNYRWFQSRYPDFLYVDRVVVAEDSRGLGIGRAFYELARARAAARGAPLTCEVNLEPPNPGSLAFHERMGFRQVGTQRTDGGRKEVSLMRWDVP